MTNIPQGQEAIDFLKRWDSARYDPTARNNICQELGITFQRARYWAQETRRNITINQQRVWNDIDDDKPCPLTRNVTHKNRYIKQSDTNPTFYTLEAQGTAVIFQDAHFPFKSKLSIAIIRRFMQDLKPEYIIIPGDWWDIYQLSKFDKNPDRLSLLQDDLDQGVNSLYWIKQENPNSKIIFCDGNHEDRLRKMLWSKNPELANLRSMNPDVLCGLIDLEIDRVPKLNTLLVNDKYQVLHGEVVSKHSGWTAKAHYEKYGGCGITGHSHRGGVYYKNSSNFYGWTENLCLCDLHPEYVKNPDWMNGFTVVTFIKDLFYPEPVPMFNNRFIYGGKLYE